MITGKSGSGKSDLALRLMDEGAVLVADDQVALSVANNGLAVLASPPAAIAGFIEARHIGVLRVPYLEAVPVALCVELAALDEKIERMPDKGENVDLAGAKVRRIKLPAFAASTTAKIRMALAFAMDTDA